VEEEGGEKKKDDKGPFTTFSVDLDNDDLNETIKYSNKHCSIFSSKGNIIWEYSLNSIESKDLNVDIVVYLTNICDINSNGFKEVPCFIFYNDNIDKYHLIIVEHNGRELSNFIREFPSGHSHGGTDRFTFSDVTGNNERELILNNEEFIEIIDYNGDEIWETYEVEASIVGNFTNDNKNELIVQYYNKITVYDRNFRIIFNYNEESINRTGFVNEPFDDYFNYMFLIDLTNDGKNNLLYSRKKMDDIFTVECVLIAINNNGSLLWHGNKKNYSHIFQIEKDDFNNDSILDISVVYLKVYSPFIYEKSEKYYYQADNGQIIKSF
jgi:hypothetical protein